MSKIALLLCAAAASISAVPAVAQTEPPAAATPATDEQAIRQINASWLNLVRKGDAAAIARLYAENGALMPPGAPLASGRAAIQKGWEGMMAMPGFDLTFETDELVISSAGDMAYDRGTYDLKANPPSGAIADKGKYIVVWRKVGGQWQVAADIFNSDGS